jgi:hypothetical protein
MTKAEVADAIRAWCRAWHTQDIPTILAMDARAVGFGFRRLAWRNHVARGEAHTMGYRASFAAKPFPGPLAMVPMCT